MLCQQCWISPETCVFFFVIKYPNSLYTTIRNMRLYSKDTYHSSTRPECKEVPVSTYKHICRFALSMLTENRSLLGHILGQVRRCHSTTQDGFRCWFRTTERDFSSFLLWSDDALKAKPTQIWTKCIREEGGPGCSCISCMGNAT